MIQVHSFTFNPFAENTFILSDETGEALIIDPGCFDADEKKTLSDYIEQKGLRPVRLLNTHAHLDHMLGNNYVAGRYGLNPEIHESDVDLLMAAPVYGQMWGINPEPSPAPSNLLKEGDRILFGNSDLEIFYTPGHSKGSVTFYSAADKFAVVGDVLFNGSIGRTDLPGGDYEELIESIRRKLLPLGDDVKVYCGHGPETSIGRERKFNPFLQE